MRKVLLFLVLSTISFLCAAQNEVEAIADTLKTVPSEVGMSSSTSLEGVLSNLSNPQNLGFSDSMNMTPEKKKDILLPIQGQGTSKFLRRNNMRQSLDISPSISVGKSSTESTLALNTDEKTTSTGWGLNFGYSLVFVPGKEKDNMLRLNEIGFGYGVGFVASFAQNDRYGTTCSFLFKLGVETGSYHAMGVGLDLLAGYGKTEGDIYLFLEGLNDGQADKVIPYTEWCAKYGLQLWMKTNLMGSLVKNVETQIFARLIYSAEPGGINAYSNMHINVWKGETWVFGTTIRYSF